MCVISVHHVSNETIGICILQMSFTHNFKISATIKRNNWEKPKENQPTNHPKQKTPKHKQTNEETNKNQKKTTIITKSFSYCQEEHSNQLHTGETEGTEE